jgi:hypothetical protein
MPGVVPGRAEITVAVQSNEKVDVTFAPIASQTAVSNAPPAEIAQAVPGETNVFAGELWLMTSGAYSINLRVRGPSGDGTVPIPVNSVAIRQLPLSRWLGAMLVALGAILCCGAIAITAAAAGESTLAPGVSPGRRARVKYWRAAAITTVVSALALVGGRSWWRADEAEFRSRLVDGGWPDLDASVRANGPQRILRLTIGEGSLPDRKNLALALDHGKLLHTFLAREPNHDAFAHLHPVRVGNKSFEVALPPLPDGDYEVLCDLTLAWSGFSSTATNVVHVPAAAQTPAKAILMETDADDSWVGDANAAARDNAGSDTVCRLPGGTQVIWKAHPCLRARQDAGLRFEVRDSLGRPAAIEPYMGMTTHAAVLRADGRVFSHLHPMGNYSMAAQLFFEDKIGTENPIAGKVKAANAEPICGPGGIPNATTPHSASAGTSATISVPYEFPSAGNYRLWVQVKLDGRVMTAIFDTTVL